MSVEVVKAYFSQFGLDDRIQEFSVSSATVELAVQALNCAPERIAKTLSFKVKRFKTVFPACGSSNSAIEMTISELEQYSQNTAWVDVCKNWQPEL